MEVNCDACVDQLVTNGGFAAMYDPENQSLTDFVEEDCMNKAIDACADYVCYTDDMCCD